jgi:predicted ATPase
MHYIGDAYPSFFDQACKDHKYNAIFVLPPWKDIYISDAERYENYEQAQLIHTHLMETYQKYGYSIIEVPKDTVEKRVDFIVKRLAL